MIFARTGWVVVCLGACWLLIAAAPPAARADADADYLAAVTKELAGGQDANAQIEGMLGADPFMGTRLHVASSRGLRASVEFLLSKGADVNNGSFDLKGPVDGKTPLALAARNGHLDVVKLLLDKGAKVEPNAGRSPLWCAAAGGHKAVAELLLAKGAQAKAPADAADTPLHAAAGNGHFVMAELLCTAGADPSADLEKSGRTPLRAALNGGHVALATMLVLKGASVKPTATANPLVAAAGLGDRGLVELMLDRGAEVMGADSGRSALHAAAEKGYVETARLLLDRGAVVDSRDDGARTPLHLAAGHDDYGAPTVTLLIARGANVKMTDYQAETPLHKTFNPDVIRALLGAGARADERDGAGRTALHRAAAFNRPAAVRTLLDAKADRTLKDKDGKTALELTANEEVRKLLAAP